jgi:hypothetical protein
MLATDTDDSFMVLVRYVERNRSRHFLFDKIQTTLSGFILISTNIDVKVVLVEPIEDDLDVTYSRSAIFHLSRTGLALETYFVP